LSDNPAQTAYEGRGRSKRKEDPHGLIGKSIANGRYAVESVIGVGGMGVVYKGRQSAVDRVVAIKVLMPEMVSDESLIKRFHLEARAASRLHHPNTITIHDFGREGDLLYIVMEYLEGESVQSLLRREKVLDPERTARIMAQCCSSLTKPKGIIHRDIKPDNIFLRTVGSERDSVKVSIRRRQIA
jgi:serine/threonine-protein kinase